MGSNGRAKVADDAGEQTGVSLRMVGITKRFGPTVANDDISLTLKRGEMLGLLGENGAGKSTLMKVLYGLYRPDSGRILVDGRPVRLESPSDAVALGIGMVHQHFMLIPALTVTENIVLGAEPGGWNRLDYERACAQVAELAKRFGLYVDPTARVRDLGVGLQQRVEILRALYKKAQVLVLDEPTAVLTPQEADQLFDMLTQLTDNGVGVIFISHKLRELVKVTDRITVLRDGKVVDTVETVNTSESALAQLMVGRPVATQIAREKPAPGKALLVVEGLSAEGKGDAALDAVQLSLRAGEIVGVAGVEGSGQVTLAEAIAGTRKIKSGKVYLDGDDIATWDAQTRFAAGMAYVPEDRTIKGLVQGFRVWENAGLKGYKRSPFTRRGFLSRRALRNHAKSLIEQFDVRPAEAEALTKELSGGNQQKLVLARELAGDPMVIIVAQPTRGVDIGAIEAIHQRMLTERGKGRAVLLFSLELDEIRALADRIAVMAGGRIVGVLSPAEATDKKLGMLMAGAT